MRRFFAAIAIWAAFSAPAAAISIIAGTDTGGALGHSFATASTTIAVTTTASVPSGGLIVAMPSGGTLTWSSCTDSASNTYSAALANTLNGARAVRLFYSIAANTLSSGGTITCTSNSSSGAKTMVAVAFSGLAASPLDAASVTASATGTTYAVGPTGTLAYPGGSNGEVLIGYVQAASTAPTNDPAFTDLGTFNNGSGTQAPGSFGYKLVSSNSPITYSPTGASSAYAGNLAAFIGTGGGGGSPAAHNLSTLGAGR